jgi:hypothetical protein
MTYIIVAVVFTVIGAVIDHLFFAKAAAAVEQEVTTVEADVAKKI